MSATAHNGSGVLDLPVSSKIGPLVMLKSVTYTCADTSDERRLTVSDLCSSAAHTRDINSLLVSDKSKSLPEKENDVIGSPIS
jgi:hypothetical protein